MSVCKWLRTMTRGLAPRCCFSVRGLKSALNSQASLCPVRAATVQNSRHVDWPTDLQLESLLKITRHWGLCSSAVTFISSLGLIKTRIEKSAALSLLSRARERLARRVEWKDSCQRCLAASLFCYELKWFDLKWSWANCCTSVLNLLNIILWLEYRVHSIGRK